MREGANDGSNNQSLRRPARSFGERAGRALARRRLSLPVDRLCAPLSSLQCCTPYRWRTRARRLPAGITG
ncbi:hypothetical protein [Lysobacter gummosus]|uniref:hypothetical protein n=1 Tax=Lysobacter gummosus TaxID=262324 RepID=UPI0036339073